MNRYLKIGLFGFILWMIPFAVSVLIFPLRSGQRPLFESVMPVVIAIWTVFFSIIYFSKGYGIFSAGHFMIPLADYVADIAIIYLMIPAITSGFGYLVEHNCKMFAEQ